MAKIKIHRKKPTSDRLHGRDKLPSNFTANTFPCLIVLAQLGFAFEEGKQVEIRLTVASQQLQQFVDDIVIPQHVFPANFTHIIKGLLDGNKHPDQLLFDVTRNHRLVLPSENVDDQMRCIIVLCQPKPLEKLPNMCGRDVFQVDPVFF